MPDKPHIDLRTLASNTYVDGIYCIYNPQVGTTRQGKTYLKCLLRDATGEVSARQWSLDEKAYPQIEASGFVWVAGHTQLYNGQVQLIIEQIKAVEVGEEEMAALLPTTTRDIGEMFEELKTLLGGLKHPAMKGLADAYIGDEDLMTSFRRAPAAASIHHAWIGGLLEHTLQVMKLADVTLPLYPHLNRDIVLMGLFLHDLGKTTELSWEQGFGYTTDGNLIGHIVRGTIWLQVKAAIAGKQSGHKLPPDALRVLQHIIISHHGVPEFGAVKVPATPEAVFISLLDNMDAKTQLALTSAQRDDTAEQIEAAPFTDKVWALGTRVYRKDPLAGAGE